MNNLKLTTSYNEENKMNGYIIFIQAYTQKYRFMTLNIKEYIEVAISDLLMFLLEDIDEAALTRKNTLENEAMITYSDDEFENILFNSKRLNELTSFESLKTYLTTSFCKNETVEDIKRFLIFYNAVADKAVKKGYYVHYRDLYIKLIELPKELDIVMRPREELEALRKEKQRDLMFNITAKY